MLDMHEVIGSIPTVSTIAKRTAHAVLFCYGEIVRMRTNVQGASEAPFSQSAATNGSEGHLVPRATRGAVQIPTVSTKKLSNPIGLLNFLSKPTKEAWYVINAPRALYGIATKSRMASRASVHYTRRLEYIQHFVLIPYSPCGLRTYRLRRIPCSPSG